MYIEETFQEMDVSFLTSYGEPLLVNNTDCVIVFVSLFSTIVHGYEQKEGGNHHAGTPFACLTMNHNSRCLILVLWLGCLFILLHPLQKQTRI